MFNYYRELARKYGGKIHCEMRGVFTILMPDGTIQQEFSSVPYELVDRDVEIYDQFHPLNSLRISTITGQFMDEMSDEGDRRSKESIINSLIRLIGNKK